MLSTASIQEAFSLMCRRCFFGWDVNTSWPSNRSWGSGSFCTRLTASKLLRSMYLLATIWATSLAGTGEKQGPTKNCWSSKGDVEMDDDIEGYEGRHYHINGKSRPTLLLKCCSCGQEISSWATQQWNALKHELAIETETDELETSTEVECGGIVNTGRDWSANRSVANAAWAVWATNEAMAGEISPLPPETAWDVLEGNLLSKVSFCEVGGVPEPISPLAICKVLFIECKPMTKYK